MGFWALGIKPTIGFSWAGAGDEKTAPTRTRRNSELFAEGIGLLPGRRTQRFPLIIRFLGLFVRCFVLFAVGPTVLRPPARSPRAKRLLISQEADWATTFQRRIENYMKLSVVG